MSTLKRRLDGYCATNHELIAFVLFHGMRGFLLGIVGMFIVMKLLGMN